MTQPKDPGSTTRLGPNPGSTTAVRPSPLSPPGGAGSSTAVRPSPLSPPGGAGSSTAVRPSPLSPPGGAGSATAVRGAVRGSLSPKALELGRGLLSALFMALRTAQIHDPGNKAFERAVAAVRAGADALYAVTGGFSINFVDESAFLNGIRLRFDGGAFDAMRTLRHILESKELGGIEMRTPPSYDAIRKLVLLFSAQPGGEPAVTKEDLLALQIGVLGVQRFADASRDGIHIDRRVFAVQSYAKLLLAFREQYALADRSDRSSHAPRLRAVRVVQDLVELAGDRPDFLLRLGSNHLGAPVDDLHAVNTSVLAVALGRALGLGRQDLVDIGVSALFHDLGRSEAVEPAPVPHANIPVLSASGDGPVSYEGELALSDDWDEGRGELDLGTAPLPASSSQADAASYGARPERDGPVAYAGALTLAEDEDEDAPVVLPLEYLGDLQPLDPADPAELGEAAGPDTLDSDPEDEPDGPGGDPDDLGAHSGALEDLDDDGSRTDVSFAPLSAEALQALDPDLTALPDDALGLPDDALGLPDDAYGSAGAEVEGQAGHVEELLGAEVHPHTFASYVRLLVAGGVSRNGLMRAVVAAEHHDRGDEQYVWGEARRPPHLFSRIVAVCDAYDALTSGLGTENGLPRHPLDALAELQTERSGRIDPRLVDLLINVLRAFPVGTSVVLDTGERAVVATHAGGSRWDRPVVRTLSKSPRNVDLMMKSGERFVARILSTVRAVASDDDTGDLPRDREPVVDTRAR